MFTGNTHHDDHPDEDGRQATHDSIEQDDYSDSGCLDSLFALFSITMLIMLMLLCL